MLFPIALLETTKDASYKLFHPDAQHKDGQKKHEITLLTYSPLNGGNPITINYWDGRQDFYCGYSSSNFNYVAFAGYDDNGFSVNLYLDHVFVYHDL